MCRLTGVCEKHAPQEKKTIGNISLNKHRIGWRRTGSAAALQGRGSPKRSVFSQTPVGVPWCLRRLIFFGPFVSMLLTNKSPQAQHAETDPPPWHTYDVMILLLLLLLMIIKLIYVCVCIYIYIYVYDGTLPTARETSMGRTGLADVRLRDNSYTSPPMNIYSV